MCGHCTESIHRRFHPQVVRSHELAVKGSGPPTQISRFNVHAWRSRQTGIEMALNQNQTGLLVSVRGLSSRAQFAQNMKRAWLAQAQQYSFLKRRAA